MISIKRYLIVLFGLLLYSIPSVCQAEIFYIMPRVGLNVTLSEKGNVHGWSGNTLHPDGTSATFIASLAGGVHFSRLPLRFELDVSFRTDSRVRDAIGTDFVKVKLYQLTPMLNAYYDIYIPNFSLVPYIGVGIGFTTFFADTNAQVGVERYTADALASVDFTWGIITGMTFPVDRFLIDFSFRFADSGYAKIASKGLSGNVRSMNFDFLLGIRFPL